MAKGKHKEAGWRAYFQKPRMKFTAEHLEEVLEALRNGRSLNEICTDKRMPNRETIRLWQHESPDIDLAITRAREDGFYDRAERAVAEAKAAHDAALGRLAFDAERWFLGKVSKGFAEKIVVGGNKDEPIEHRHHVTLAEAPDEVLAYLAAMRLADEN